MKIRLSFLLLISTIFLSSCSKQGPVFENYQKFSQNSWDRFNQIIFNVPIDDTEGAYEFSLIIKPTNDFPYETMPVYVILKTPSGEERTNEVKVRIKEGGKFIGQKEGEPLVIKASLWKELKISDKGKCRLSVENMVPKIQTPGISEIGLIVEKVKN
ncbi:MAG: hypothetical protein IPH88_04140 [Bacteroidales bacterium]|nr:hypothetical protein [Bacteroidales bacterium]